MGALHAGQGRSVQDREVQAELLGHLLLPLQGQRSGADHQHPAGAVAQDQLVDDEAGLDRLAEPEVVATSRLTRGIASALATGSSW